MAKVFTITEGLENMGAIKTGGQGSVYKGRRIGEIISAIKLLPTPIHSESDEDKAYRDFKNEVEKLKKVNEEPNPHVVKILSYGITETGNLPFIEMEFIEGPDLEELLKPPHDQIFTIKELTKVAEQLSCALAHCHKVDVKHGDIKSNNVKLNKHTGNYMLLDFGLAIMQDEQRRTSLRQAGAIEFMAPEQNEGHMYFETDVYSFGIILYELLAGVVPFPLKEKGEIARNSVMLAHMEAAPPDALELRKQHLPESWQQAKQEREMNVPAWLLHVISKCLQKNKEDRFESGVELYDYIIHNSVLTTLGAAPATAATPLLAPQQGDTLVQENNELQNKLLQQQASLRIKETEIATLKTQLSRKEDELHYERRRQATPPPLTKVKKGVSKTSFYLLLLVTIALGILTIVALVSNDGGAESYNSRAEPQPAVVPESNTVEEPEMERTVIGEYKVTVSKAYFHNEPNEDTRRSAYLIPSEEVINALDEQNGFIYTEFTNSRGQMSKGWLKKDDLVTVDEWNKMQEEAQKASEPLSKIEINNQLQQAKAFLRREDFERALAIYKTLAEMEVPEAMYQYGNLALQNKNSVIDCKTAVNYIKKASDNDYTEAKTTLGFLYLFAENKDVLRNSSYHYCQYEKNVVRGTRLLMEAVLSGDSTAKKILDMKNETENNRTENP